MRTIILIGAAWMVACAAAPEQPIDTTTQFEHQVPGRGAPAAPKLASPAEVKLMEEHVSAQRMAVAERAKRTDRSALLVKIRATPEGPARQQLIDEYLIAVHYLEATAAEGAMKDLNRVLVTN